MIYFNFIINLHNPLHLLILVHQQASEKNEKQKRDDGNDDEVEVEVERMMIHFFL